MKTYRNIIALVAILMPIVAGANIYEDRLQTAFDDIISAVPLSSREQMVSIYSDPETGIKEGQLDVFKFTIDSNDMDLINDAKRVYEQISDNLDNSKKEVYVLWWNDNARDFQGYRLYYSPENTIIVGLACDHCYTVGFVSPDDSKHRKTYTLEWSINDDSDSINGRIITTYAPVKAKATDGHRLSSVVISSDDYDKYIEKFQAGMEKYQEGMEKYQAAMEKAQGALSGLSDGQSHSFSFSSSSSSSSSQNNAKNWMKKMLFYLEKVQQSGDRYLYLSKLYELCKNTEGLDQTDLKIAMQQLASVYKQLKEKKKLKENELVFLESMVDLLENKVNSVHYWNPD